MNRVTVIVDPGVAICRDANRSRRASNSAWQWAGPSTTGTDSYAAVNTLNQYPTITPAQNRIR